jgi:hypothetical protein
MIRSRWRWLGIAALVALIVGCVPEPSPDPVVDAAPHPTTTTTRAGAILAGENAASYAPLFDSDVDLAKSFDLMAASGAKWVRIDFYWSVVQPTATTYDWSSIDRAVNAANARGLHVLANPAYTPQWARSGSDDKYPPTDVNTYATFVQRAVQRYAPLGVHHWEIWNEPNVQQFWHPRPDPNAYAALLRAAYAVIKAADPSATVITGGTATAGPTLDSMSTNGINYSPYRWLRLLYEGGNRPYFDAVATHPYATFPYSPLEDWGSAMWTRDLHNLMVAYGDGAKKLWGTEAGYPTGTASGAVSEATQVQYIEDYLTMWSRWTDWTGPLFIYQMRDRGTSLGDRESNFGLVHNDWSPKPAYGTFDRDVG